MTRPSDETLAAFLEGRLTALERERVLEWLAASEEAREWMVDASATLTEVRTLVGERSQGTGWTRWKRTARWLAVAAGIVLLALPALRGGGTSPGERSLRVLRRAVDNEGTATAPSDSETVALAPLWSVSRGEGRPSAAAAADASFRAGASWSHLELGLQRGDVAYSERSAALLSEALGSGAGAAVLSSRLDALVQRSDGADVDVAERDILFRDLESASAAPWFALGVWAGAVQITVALGSRDRAHELSSLAGPLAAQLPDLPPGVEARGAVEGVRTALDEGDPPERVLARLRELAATLGL
ncbi:MAG: hypothetical protein R3E10_06825 [Gemmatimonadota bacterium]